MENKKIAMRVSRRSIYINLLLSIGKLIVGFVAQSGAMISDGVHSASDVFSTIFVMIGVKLSSKDADEKHQYGHERMECVAALILGILLGGTGIGIGIAGVKQIILGIETEIAIPGILALVAAILSIGVKEGMYWYTRNAAKKINSVALLSDAWHHRSDALSSIGSMIGILGARIGFPIMDPIASVVISIFIVKAAIDIFFDAIRKLIDESCDKELEMKMRNLILEQKGVEGIDAFRTRQFGAKIYIDVEVFADCELKLKDSHRIAEQVHGAIEEEFLSVKHCMVRVNPEKLSSSKE